MLKFNNNNNNNKPFVQRRSAVASEALPPPSPLYDANDCDLRERQMIHAAAEMARLASKTAVLPFPVIGRTVVVLLWKSFVDTVREAQLARFYARQQELL